MKTDDMQGTCLAGRYEIDDELGAGSMGRVFRAVDLQSGDEVAIKLLRPVYARDAMAVARLQREARLAASIASPHVVRVLAFEEDETHFLVMEYVPGPTLARLLAVHGPLPPRVVAAIGHGIAAALEAAHAHGIVHRDLKPANIKLSDGVVRVLDFGIARAMGDLTLTATGMYLGTPAYSAPERGDGLGDIRSDIYSTGIILYELLAGRPPFAGTTSWAVLHAQRTLPAPPLPAEVPPALQAVVSCCLAKDPAARFQTPGELFAALEPLPPATRDGLRSYAGAAEEDRVAAGRAPGSETPSTPDPNSQQDTAVGWPA